MECPETKKGWAKKKARGATSGTLIASLLSHQTRFFLLASGSIAYYTDEHDLTSLKGEVCLDKSTAKPVGTKEVLVSLESGSSSAENLHMEFESEDIAQEWVTAINLHCKFAAKKLAMAAERRRASDIGWVPPVAAVSPSANPAAPPPARNLVTSKSAHFCVGNPLAKPPVRSLQRTASAIKSGHTGNIDNTEAERWQEYLDPKSGAYYYHNKESNETVWDPPSCGFLGIVVKPQVQSADLESVEENLVTETETETEIETTATDDAA